MEDIIKIHTVHEKSVQISLIFMCNVNELD